MSIRTYKPIAAAVLAFAATTCTSPSPSEMSVVQRDSAVFEAAVRQARRTFPRIQFYVRPLHWPNDTTADVEGISIADARKIEARREATLLRLGAPIEPSAMLECPAPVTPPGEDPKPPSCVLGLGTSIGIPTALESELRVAAYIRADANIFTYYFKYSHGRWEYVRQGAPEEQ